jgi:hypothetical protein
MSSLTWSPGNQPASRSSAEDIMSDHRSRVQLEENARAEKRQLDLADQRSSTKSPSMRIRTWEKVHALRLPPDPAHPILAVIALDTGLSLSEVQDEQRSRRGGAIPGSP